jgi:outer membrane protein
VSSSDQRIHFADPRPEVRALRIVTVDSKQLFARADAGLPRSKEDKDPADGEALSEITRVIKAVATAKNFDFVLQDPPFQSGDNDVTPMILAAMRNEPSFDQAVASVYFKVGFVNTPRIFRDAPAAKRAAKSLGEEFHDRDVALQAMAKRVEKGEVGRDHFESVRKGFREDLQKRQKEENVRIITAANRGIKEIASREGFDLILQNVVWASPSTDMTQSVMSYLQ